MESATREKQPHSPVNVYCDENQFIVSVGKDLLNNGMALKKYQVTLGENCEVTQSRPDFLCLSYTVSDCGIQRTVVQDIIMFHSTVKISFIYYFYDGTAKIPISCSIWESNYTMIPQLSSLMLETQNETNKAQDSGPTTSRAQQNVGLS
ncbi:placenta-specific protein 1-like isoform X2 [Monodelphis domestica]|uniref:placenta-specific protein 1-like isoform X2 n=1 Tax=Monodelphis domestica TaxID=13616 RepID=UPI0004432CAC|nr:placenta-specific protein 1-like isoform X2 [Monodelphis domestica]